MSDLVTTKDRDGIVTRFMQVKGKLAALTEAKDQLKAEYDRLREELLEITRQNQVLTLKTENYTIMRKNKTSYKVENPFTVIDSMKELGLEPVMKLDVLANQSYFKQFEVKGVEKKVTEYIAIKEHKKG
jgi:hypothetical protein